MDVTKLVKNEYYLIICQADDLQRKANYAKP